MVQEFDPLVCQELRAYVYALRDLNGTVFYVGKGQGNRCFQHLDEARSNVRGTVKLDTIRQIWNDGGDVRIDIEISRAVMDCFGGLKADLSSKGIRVDDFDLLRRPLFELTKEACDPKPQVIL